jgi:hypothetical protein
MKPLFSDSPQKDGGCPYLEKEQGEDVRVRAFERRNDTKNLMFRIIKIAKTVSEISVSF